MYCTWVWFVCVTTSRMLSSLLPLPPPFFLLFSLMLPPSILPPLPLLPLPLPLSLPPPYTFPFSFLAFSLLCFFFTPLRNQLKRYSNRTASLLSRWRNSKKLLKTCPAHRRGWCLWCVHSLHTVGLKLTKTREPLWKFAPTLDLSLLFPDLSLQFLDLTLLFLVQCLRHVAAETTGLALHRPN